MTSTRKPGHSAYVAAVAIQVVGWHCSLMHSTLMRGVIGDDPYFSYTGFDTNRNLGLQPGFVMSLASDNPR